ncbi:MAG: helix-turn-helix domain-containing protein [Patescibacteria group bacterium]
MVIPTLKQLGLSDKEARVYLALLARGQASIRMLAQETKVNRGTTHDILKSLMVQGLISTTSRAGRNYYLAEHPQKLGAVIRQRISDLEQAREDVEKILPELHAMMAAEQEAPVVKYFEGLNGIRSILEDVLETVGLTEDLTYFAYSVANIRHVMLEAYPTFSQERIRRGIQVKVIALGEGGQLVGLDERKWLPQQTNAPTYQLLYQHKVASIALNSTEEPFSILIEHRDIAQMQQRIFAHLWSLLPPEQLNDAHRSREKQRSRVATRVVRS